MRNSIPFHRLAIGRSIRLTSACVALFASSVAVGSDNCGTLDRAANAMHLAEVLYPELKGKELSLQCSEGSGPLSGPTDVRSLVIAVDKPGWRPPTETSGHSESPSRDAQNSSLEVDLPLYLEFNFVRTIVDNAGKVVGTELSCQPSKFSNTVGGKQIHEAAEAINAHPEWTDAQDVEAAEKLGMRFGPDKKTDLLQVLPLKGLSSVYGPLQITEAKFRIAGLKEPESYFADLHWFVTAKRVGTQKTLQIMVEPFQGKIIGITE
jgi:hypothetical protein